MSKAVVLLSGGLDSTTLAYWVRSGGKTLYALSVYYGQRHSKELRQAQAIADKLGLVEERQFRVLRLEPLRELLSGSALTSDDVFVPEGHYAAESMKTTVVPNRNMILLSIAVGWAISLGADSVYYAAHTGDHAIYPDCRPEFVYTLNQSVRSGNYNSPTIYTPFISMTKQEIVRLGTNLHVPYELTWSCYKGGDDHCGRCGTCVERREAFEIARVPDPTRYAE